MIIDAYTHLAPRSFLSQMNKMSPDLRNIIDRLLSVKELYDLDARFRAMDVVDDYRQIISLPNPSLEECTSPELGGELARIANIEMAELCKQTSVTLRRFRRCSVLERCRHRSGRD